MTALISQSHVTKTLAPQAPTSFPSNLLIFPCQHSISSHTESVVPQCLPNIPGGYETFRTPLKVISFVLREGSFVCMSGHSRCNSAPDGIEDGSRTGLAELRLRSITWSLSNGGCRTVGAGRSLQDGHYKTVAFIIGPSLPDFDCRTFKQDRTFITEGP
jgi:hypothetical protein